MSRRAMQIASLIERAVKDVLARGLDDPRVKGLLTVTGVTVTDDLHQATISVSVLPAENGELALHALKHASKHLRHQVSERVDLRRVPELQFRLDESLKRQADVLNALAEVAKERGEDAPDDAPADEGEDAS